MNASNFVKIQPKKQQKENIKYVKQEFVKIASFSFLISNKKVMRFLTRLFSIHAHIGKYLKSLTASPRRTKLYTLPELLPFLGS